MDEEVKAFLQRHLKAVHANDTAAYRETTSEDLTLYEWWVTPNRIEGLPFHEFMMESNAARGTVFGSDAAAQAPTRFDLANLSIQRYGDAAVASYTLILSSAEASGVKVSAHNESRVMVRQSGAWKVVHVHKSPSWQAPHTAPG